LDAHSPANPRADCDLGWAVQQANICDGHRQSAVRSTYQIFHAYKRQAQMPASRP
jgi:hypothetical protein